MSSAPSGKSESRSDGPKARTAGLLLRISLFLLIASSLTLGAGFYVYDRFIPAKFAESGPTIKDIKIEIASGSGVDMIARKLHAAGVIKTDFWFRVKGRLMTQGVSLKAGEYLIPAGSSINQIFKQLQEGQVIQYGITIAEGLTVRDVVSLLLDNDILSGTIDVLPEEGQLQPETWHVVRGSSRADLLKRMQDAQAKTLAELWEGRAPDLPLKSPQEALILASIIEKETAIPAERDRVAAVFINRLRKGMRLESDPTIVYGLTGGKPLGRGLRRSEIDKKTPWNTYKIRGLPPTPIANPGRDSIYAALHPADTNDLYFVADGTGGHAFARTYAGHLRNVAKWRRIERERKRKAKR